jgi:hypothetical protein
LNVIVVVVNGTAAFTNGGIGNENGRLAVVGSSKIDTESISGFTNPAAIRAFKMAWGIFLRRVRRVIRYVA